MLNVKQAAHAQHHVIQAADARHQFDKVKPYIISTRVQQDCHFHRIFLYGCAALSCAAPYH